MSNTTGRDARGTRDKKTLRDDPLLFLSYVNPATRFAADGAVDFTPFFQESRWVQGSLPRMRRGGVDAVALSFGLNEPELYPGQAGVSRLLLLLSAFHRAAKAHSRAMEIARGVKDIRRIHAAGKVAILLHLTGVPLNRSLDWLQAFYALGVRTVHVSFDMESGQTQVNVWRDDAPLTPFGRDVIREMGRLRMMVDLAHASDRMIRQVLAVADGPVIVSHTMCRALCDTKRNITDEQIRRVAARGGVIGIHFAAQLMDGDYARRQAASGFHAALKHWDDRLRRKYPDPFEYAAHRYNQEAWMKTRACRLQQSVPLPPLSRVIDHIDHLVNVAGIDHVGIGSDYDLGTIPVELNRVDKLPNLTRALLARGYGKADVRKILGDNFMRVYGQVLKE